MLCIRRGAALLVSAALGLGAACSVAAAADMPVKAPPPASPFVLDVHGFVDVTFKNTSVTPRGLMVREYSGLTTQVANGLRARRVQGSGRIHQRRVVLRRHLERHLVEEQRSQGRQLGGVRLVGRHERQVRPGIGNSASSTSNSSARRR